MSHAFHPTVLREYDIRGIIGETLGAEDARALGRAYATLLRADGGSRVAVGYDGRLSSPMLEAALVEQCQETENLGDLAQAMAEFCLLALRPDPPRA